MKLKKIEYADKRKVRSVARDGSGKRLKELTRQRRLLALRRDLTFESSKILELDRQLEEMDTYIYQNFIQQL